MNNIQLIFNLINELRDYVYDDEAHMILDHLEGRISSISDHTNNRIAFDDWVSDYNPIPIKSCEYDSIFQYELLDKEEHIWTLVNDAHGIAKYIVPGAHTDATLPVNGTVRNYMKTTKPVLNIVVEID